MIYIDPNWNFRKTVEHIKAIKGDYQEILSSFSVFQTKEWADFIVSTRNKFYSLNCTEKQIEKLWRYMNGYLPLHVLKDNITRSQKKHK